MTEKWKIYKNILIPALQNLANKDYQKRVWLNLDNPNNLIDSFIETVISVFDDAVVIDALRAQQIIFDSKVTQALWRLHDATDAVNEYRPEEDIIADPLMEVVRVRAAEALALIEASDGSESTVEIIK